MMKAAGCTELICLSKKVGQEAGDLQLEMCVWFQSGLELQAVDCQNIHRCLGE